MSWTLPRSRKKLDRPQRKAYPTCRLFARRMMIRRATNGPSSCKASYASTIGRWKKEKLPLANRKRFGKSRMRWRTILVTSETIIENTSYLLNGKQQTANS